MNGLLRGKLVHLVTANSETDAETMARWSRDSEYQRLLDSDPARPKSAKHAKEEIAEWMEHERPDNFGFVIRTLAEDRLIGFVGLGGINWPNGDGFVGIGIGERKDGDKGYGTDAMRVILQYAFAELNLYRVSLDVFGENRRAIRSYEKVGFVVEGCERQYENRDGHRCDMIYMGILHEEWERGQKG